LTREHQNSCNRSSTWVGRGREKAKVGERSKLSGSLAHREIRGEQVHRNCCGKRHIANVRDKKREIKIPGKARVSGIFVQLESFSQKNSDAQGGPRKERGKMGE